MIRTVWLAVLCLGLDSALAAGKAVRTPAVPAVAELPTDDVTLGIDRARDTLSKANRLEVNYVREEPPPQLVSQSIEPAAPIITPPSPPTETKITSRHWRDPNAFSSSLKYSQRAESKKKSKNDRKTDQAADRSKPSEPVKPCSRPGPLSDLLRAVHLSPACGS
jgi:hypothetical protein